MTRTRPTRSGLDHRGSGRRGFGLAALLLACVVGCGGTKASATADETPSPRDTAAGTDAAAGTDTVPRADAAAASPTRAYWDRIARPVATTAAGHRSAVSCHNCYLDLATAEANLAATLRLLHDAQARGADFLELDVKDEAGAIHVDHEDDGGTNGALLADVLTDPALQAGDQILFLEIKEGAPTDAFVGALLDTLVAHGFPSEGRPVVLRAFDGPRREALAIADRLLDAPERGALRDLVLLHVLYGRDAIPDPVAFAASIRAVAAAGWHGVEIQHQDRNLLAAVAAAHEEGLAVNVWTIPDAIGAALVAALRDLVDVLTVDYPVDRTRAVVEADDGVLLLAEPLAFDGAAAGRSFPDAAGRRPFPAARRPFPAARPGGGWLVSAGVSVPAVELAPGARQTIVASADGGFSLELAHEDGAAVVRFGVRTTDGWAWASAPADRLATDTATLVTGAWDGAGQVTLWLNDDTDGTTPGATDAALVSAEGPIVVGAGFEGVVERVQVLRWGPR